jgi:hypothetical protein
VQFSRIIQKNSYSRNTSRSVHSQDDSMSNNLSQCPSSKSRATEKVFENPKVVRGYFNTETNIENNEEQYKKGMYSTKFKIQEDARTSPLKETNYNSCNEDYILLFIFLFIFQI